MTDTNETDNVVCVVCGADLSSLMIESYTVIRWVPEKSDATVKNYCAEHEPHYYAVLDRNTGG